MKILLKPYPFLYPTKKNVILALALFLVIFAINYFINDVQSTQQHFTVSRLEFAATFGLITAVSFFLLFDIAPRLFFSNRLKESWTIGKEFSFIILLFCIIIISNYFYIISVARNQVYFCSWSIFLFIGFSGIIIGLAPTLFITLINYTVILKRNLKEAHSYNAQLKSKLPTPLLIEQNQEIELHSNNLKETILIHLSQLCFIKSEGNYVEVYTCQNNQVQKKTYRASIQSIQEQLTTYPYIARAHRSYLVNLQNIQHTEGNARNFQLHFWGTDLTVPVSRSKFQEISGQLPVNSQQK
jgi:hypothetical protein